MGKALPTNVQEPKFGPLGPHKAGHGGVYPHAGARWESEAGESPGDHGPADLAYLAVNNKRHCLKQGGGQGPRTDLSSDFYVCAAACVHLYSHMCTHIHTHPHIYTEMKTKTILQKISQLAPQEIIP